MNTVCAVCSFVCACTKLWTRKSQLLPHAHHHHQSLNREGRWGTTDDFAISFLHFFPVLHCPVGLAELQACPVPCLPCLPPPLTVPCKMVLARPDEREK